MAEVSVVIVTYNGLHDNTAPCLRSIFSESSDEDYEVIVVDNDSKDGTQAFLAEMADSEPRLRYLLNKTNRGFAGGNNDGIRAATGTIIVLLNNDTLVGSGWLTGLRDALQMDRSIGLVGPVSNYVGNEQRIFTRGSTPAEILKEGRSWTNISRGDSFQTDRLGFFCVAFRSELIERVGFLDESYGLGFYEDDDYCLRVCNAGYRLVCHEDLFVYHRGSASFEKAPELTRHLLARNRRLLEAKIGGKYRPVHPRERQLDLIEEYVRKANEVEERGRMLAKIDNRMNLLATLTPRGIFKRIKFFMRVRRIRESIRLIACGASNEK
jgi:GT2 family glycosyltransferase